MANVGIIDATLTSMAESKGICTEQETDKDVNVQVCSKMEEYDTALDKADNDRPQEGMENGVENGKGSDQQALQDVGNRFSVSTAAVLPKKSLLKRPKSETSNPNISLNPPKRIRIVEDLEAVTNGSHSHLSDGSESPDILEGADDVASVTEVSSCGETLRWLNSSSSSIDQASINVEFVRDNLTPVKRAFSVEIDMRFILTETCTSILNSKTRIAEVGPSRFDLWISRHSLHHNPNLKQISYKENFLKMANIDAILNYDLTSPAELNSDPAVVQNEENVYYVGDLWQKSKGFREYLLWKTSQAEKLFSTKIFTIKTLGPNSTEALVKQKAGLLLPEISASTDEVDLAQYSTENVEAFGSSTKAQNILDVENINNYVRFVLLRTNEKGLHTFVADNSELSYAYESCREIRFQKYLYCQFLLALRSLREGGTFICKIFDTFTLFTNGLLFLMYKCFKNIAVHKPSSSSTCSSERFLICKGKIDNADTKYVIDFLSDCLDMVVNNQEQRKIMRRRVRKRLTVVKMEVQRLVPLRLILSHAEFFQFVRESNIRLTNKLAESIHELCRLMEQSDKTQLNNLKTNFDKLHQSLLSSWNVQNGHSVEEKLHDPMKELERFLTENAISSEMCSLKKLELGAGESTSAPREVLVFPVQLSSTGSVFKSMHGWFFGCGGSKLLHLHNNVWTKVDYTEFSLPRGTLVFGEISEEVHIVGEKQKFVRSFHLFDATFIRGMYIGSSPFITRQAILTRCMTTLKNLSANVNVACFVIPAISSNELSKFYRSTKRTDLLGYSKFVKCHQRQGDDPECRDLTLVDGFLMINSVQDLSPQTFFSRCEQLVLSWKKEEDDMKSYLEELESRLC